MLLATAVGSHALSIGRVRGAAWIGQTLDVTVPVRLEAGEDATALCFDADVFHSDTRVEPRNVRVLTESAPVAGSDAREVTVRVRSSVIVDELVVTIYLKVGCDQKVTRRLVLLADVPTETSSAIAVAPLPVIPLPPSGVPASSASGRNAPARGAAPSGGESAAAAGGSASTATGAARSGATPAPRPPRPARAPRPAAAAAPVVPRAAAPAPAASPSVAPRALPAPAPAAAAAAPAVSAPRARLQLDPAEMPPERDLALRSSGTLGGTPAEDEARRAEAAAIWRSINSQPDDVLRDTQRLQQMEASLNALRTQMQQNQSSMSAMKTQLEQAQTERYSNPFVYILLALLILALGAAGYLWQRLRRSPASRQAADWWRDVDHRNPNTVQIPPVGPIPGITEPPAPRVRNTRSPAPARNTAAGGSALDLDLGFDDDDDDAPSSLITQQEQRTVGNHAPHLPRRMQNDFHSSFGGSGRSMNTEELFDVHQQADFFVSLGQHEQAIGVLMSHIRDNPETSALAYLDLFSIYHQQGREAQYNQLRDEFQSVFNADVPEFAAFNDVGRGLEKYAATLGRIEQLWGSADSITLIEELIFRRPDEAVEGEPFDLEAYKELLLLFAIALEVSEGDDEEFHVSGPAPASAFAVIDDSAPGPLTMPPSLDAPATYPAQPVREASVSLSPLPDFDLSSEPMPMSTPVAQPAAPRATTTDIDFELSDSMVAPLSSLPKPKPPAGSNPVENAIEFELFDPSTEAEIDPTRKKK